MELATHQIKLGKGMPSKIYKNYKIKFIFNDYHGEASHTFQDKIRKLQWKTK
jgi:hypothetical protein